MKKLYVTTPTFIETEEPLSDAYVVDFLVTESSVDSTAKINLYKANRGDNKLLLNTHRIIANKIDYEGWVHTYLDTALQFQPDIVVIPSILERCQKTIELADYWVEKASSTTTVGVVEATSYEEAVTCYNGLKDKVDIIAFSTLIFNAEEALTILGTNASMGEINSKCRELIIDHLVSQGVLDTNKQHMLQYVWTPADYDLVKNRSYISSVLTRIPSIYSLREETLSDSIVTYDQLDNRVAYLNKIDDNDTDELVLERINNSIDYIKQAINT